MSESVLKKFGKYFLLDRIGEGGMADIFRARVASHDANGRFVVIKRIQGAYSNNQEFVQMFRSEVQVTMRFTHPNIVQLYEAGEEAGQQYIAMELVDGRNLRQVLSKLAHKQNKIPVPASAFIVEQTAAGLHYAHTFKDRITGEALNLVHRDVSPQNILVSYDGTIKVIDFGIAKATTNGEATRAGVIKGKLSYLSPEQVMGEVLDARSDVFALGIVLWELLTGKRLFVAEGDNEFQVLKMIESCNTFVKPPSTINPEVSKELDQIVMMALARDPKKRYQSGEELARSLRKLLAVQYSDFGPSDLSQFVKKLFHDLIVDDRKQLKQLNDRAEELISLGEGNNNNNSGSIKIPGEGNGTNDGKDHTRVTNFVGNKFEKSQLTGAERVEVAGQPQRQLKVSINHRPANNGPTVSPAYGSSRKTSASISMPQPVAEDESSGMGGFMKFIFVAASLGCAFYFGYPYVQKHQGAQADRGLQSQGYTSPVAASGKQSLVRFHVFPDGDVSKTKVTLNSQPVDLVKGQIEAPVGEPIEVMVERPGFLTFRKEFTIKDTEIGAAKDFNLDVKLEPMVYGLLSISTKPALADVTVISLDQRSPASSQRPLTLKTPIDREKLPAGHYKILIQNDILGVEKSFQVEVKEGKEENYTDLQLETKN